MTEVLGNTVIFRYLYPNSRDKPEQTSNTKIYVSGEFNNWSKTDWMLTNRGDGLYEYSTQLKPGKYPYVFLVNGKECFDDSVDDSIEENSGRTLSIIKIEKDAIKSSTPRQYARVLFSVYAPVKHGVTISVCGDLWALGSFTPQDAMRMYTTPELYPIWKTRKPVVVSRDSPFRYRYLQFCAGEFSSFEYMDQSREFLPKPEHSELILLQDTYSMKEKSLSSVPASPTVDFSTDSAITMKKRIGSTLSDKTTDSQRIQNILNCDEHITKQDVLIIATYRLPVRIKLIDDKWQVEWDEENFMSPSYQGLYEHSTVYYIGTISNLRCADINHCINMRSIMETNKPLFNQLKTILRNDFNCISLEIEETLESDYYYGYCKQILFPILHNILTVYDTVSIDAAHHQDFHETEKKNPQYWEAYREVNAEFADAILDFCSEQKLYGARSPLIWCDDYQLILLPYELRKREEYSCQSCGTPSSPFVVEKPLFTLPIGQGLDSPIGAAATNTFSFINKKPAVSPTHKDKPFLRRRLSMDSTDFVIPPSNTHINEYETIYEVSEDDETYTPFDSRNNTPRAIDQLHDFHPLITAYINTAWPTYEVLRCLPSRRRIIRGLLSANLVGFHSYIHARHFIAGCVRLLGLQSGTSMDGNLTITYRNRKVIVTQTHTGIDTHKIQTLMQNEEVHNHAKEHKNIIGDRHCVLSINDLSRNTGIPLLLQGFEYFLKSNPKVRDHICLFLIVYLPRSKLVRPQIQNFSIKEIEDLTRDINQKYPNSIYLNMSPGSSVPIKERLSYYLAADIYLDCVIREGLNLHHMEYTFCRKDSPGVLILSEYSTSSSFFNGAIPVNPWNYDDISQTLCDAYNATKEDRLEKQRRDYNAILSRTLSDWSVQVIKDLKRCQIDNNICTSNNDNVSSQFNIPLLPFDYFKRCYKQCQTRFFIIDYGGTIAAKEEFETDVKHDIWFCMNKEPKKEMIQVLKRLADDPKNYIFIVSGSTQQFMNGVFGKYNNLGLVADGGTVISWPKRSENSEREWEEIKYDGFNDNDWKKKVRKIMDHFTLLTNGSSIDDNPHQLRWDIQFTDPEWGKFQADSMVEKLEAELEDKGVEISREIGAVCVTPLGYNRGLLVKELMKRYHKLNCNRDPGLIFAVGDDACDEPIFTYLSEFLRSKNYNDYSKLNEEIAGNQHCITCHIGNSAKTHSSYYLPTVDDLQYAFSALSS